MKTRYVSRRLTIQYIIFLFTNVILINNNNKLSYCTCICTLFVHSHTIYTMKLEQQHEYGREFAGDDVLLAAQQAHRDALLLLGQVLEGGADVLQPLQICLRLGHEANERFTQTGKLLHNVAKYNSVREPSIFFK
jgi:hypothetical protein